MATLVGETVRSRPSQVDRRVEVRERRLAAGRHESPRPRRDLALQEGRHPRPPRRQRRLPEAPATGRRSRPARQRGPRRTDGRSPVRRPGRPRSTSDRTSSGSVAASRSSSSSIRGCGTTGGGASKFGHAVRPSGLAAYTSSSGSSSTRGVTPSIQGRCSGNCLGSRSTYVAAASSISGEMANLVRSRSWRPNRYRTRRSPDDMDSDYSESVGPRRIGARLGGVRTGNPGGARDEQGSDAQRGQRRRLHRRRQRRHRSAVRLVLQRRPAAWPRAAASPCRRPRPTTSSPCGAASARW